LREVILTPTRRIAGALLLASSATCAWQSFFLPPPIPYAGAMGALSFAIALLLLLRAGAPGLWLGAIGTGIAALLGQGVAFFDPSPLVRGHVAVGWVVTALCLYELFRRGRLRALVVVVAALFVGCGAGLFALAQLPLHDPFVAVYDENCSLCHGEGFEGMPIGPALVGRDLVHGDSMAELVHIISEGSPAAGMPPWKDTLSETEIRGLAQLIIERRSDMPMFDFKVDAPLVVPSEPLESERHRFRIETVATDLDPLLFSIAPLPDGRILLTEKARGLSFISHDGEQSALVEGTPPVHAGGLEPPGGLVFGLGWLLDVALHPEFEDNGWVYLHFSDRCEGCDTSMNKLVRAHIAGGQWVDEETIWEADPSFYSSGSDMGRGGRISFDDRGHVFLSIGGDEFNLGIQDLAQPFGKIHRVRDDGSVPEDNPFVGVEGALASTWTFGHRSPQGLEFDPASGLLWSTEMGPRGGDEFNLLEPGKNYGWPLTSKGLDYDGTAVDYGKQLGIEPDLSKIEQPRVDLTPGPAVSSFVLYHGDMFPAWRGDAIVGTLKATELYRFVLDGDRVVHRETLLRGIARIRDVEVAPDGSLLLLLEHASGGRIVRLIAD